MSQLIKLTVQQTGLRRRQVQSLTQQVCNNFFFGSKFEPFILMPAQHYSARHRNLSSSAANSIAFDLQKQEQLVDALIANRHSRDYVLCYLADRFGTRHPIYQSYACQLKDNCGNQASNANNQTNNVNNQKSNLSNQTSNPNNQTSNVNNQARNANNQTSNVNNQASNANAAAQELAQLKQQCTELQAKLAKVQQQQQEKAGKLSEASTRNQQQERNKDDQNSASSLQANGSKLSRAGDPFEQHFAEMQEAMQRHFDQAFAPTMFDDFFASTDRALFADFAKFNKRAFGDFASGASYQNDQLHEQQKKPNNNNDNNSNDKAALKYYDYTMRGESVNGEGKIIVEVVTNFRGKDQHQIKFTNFGKDRAPAVKEIKHEAQEQAAIDQH